MPYDTICSLLATTAASAGTLAVLAATEANTFFGFPIDTFDRLGVVAVLAIVGAGAFATCRLLFSRLEAIGKERLAQKDEEIKRLVDEIEKKDKAIDWYRDKMSK